MARRSSSPSWVRYYIYQDVSIALESLNRMLDTLRTDFDIDDISLDVNFLRDLNWFIKCVFRGCVFGGIRCHLSKSILQYENPPKIRK